MNWDARYKNNDIPWDKGEAAPALVQFLRSHIVEGKVLVPGCGFGHDCSAIAKNGSCRVLGLDVSKTAILKAQTLYGSTKNLEFHEGNLLKKYPILKSKFDWVIEHTCLCALEPQMRNYYVDFITYVLKPGAHFFGIFFKEVIDTQGPPFACDSEEIIKLFGRYFEFVEIWSPKSYFAGRENLEICYLMKRR